MEIRTYTVDTYKDIPVPYAIFKIIYADDGNVANTQYVYVNESYCQTAGIRREDLIGRYFLDVYGEGERRWLYYCQEAVTTGKTVHETIYSPEVQQWMNFAVQPLSQPGYVSFVFMNISKEHAREVHVQRERVTNEAIVRIAKILNDGESYEAAMNHALEEISRFIHPDRIYLLETDGVTVSNTFEWCAEGIESEIGTLQNLPYEEYISGWEVFLRDSPGVIMEDIEVLRRMGDMVDYENLKRQGIKRLMAFPFYRQGHIAGFLVGLYGVDHVYRLGGDEFVVLLQHMTEDEFAGQLKRLRDEASHLGNLSIAVGGKWIADAGEIMEAIQEADNAMYRDKAEYYKNKNKK